MRALPRNPYLTVGRQNHDPNGLNRLKPSVEEALGRDIRGFSP